MCVECAGARSYRHFRRLACARQCKRYNASIRDIITQSQNTFNSKVMPRAIRIEMEIIVTASARPAPRRRGNSVLADRQFASRMARVVIASARPVVLAVICFALALCFRRCEFSQADGQWPPLRQHSFKTPHRRGEHRSSVGGCRRAILI